MAAPRRPGRWPWAASAALHAAAVLGWGARDEPPRTDRAVLELRLEAASAASAGDTYPLPFLDLPPPPEVDVSPDREPVFALEPPVVAEADVLPEPALEAPAQDVAPGPAFRPADGRVAIRPFRRVPSGRAEAARPAFPRRAASSGAPQVEGAVAWATNRPPAYPPPSRARGEQGVVVLHVGLDDTGAVVEAVVVESSGFPLLDAAALDAVRTWRFRPAAVDGRPVATALRQRVRFALGNS
jgi:protein TonB